MMMERSSSNAEERQQFLITKDDLISWYMDNYLKDILDSDDLVSKEYEKISKVINRMIYNDLSLIVSFDILLF